MKALKQRLGSESMAGVIFTLPFTIGFLLFMVVPMGISLYYSFCDYNILSPPVFSGMKNFITMFQDKTFFQSLKVTFFFAFVSVPLKLLFALLVAMLLLKNSRMSGFYRAAYYLPSIIGGSVAVSILWKRMFAMDGVINKLLGSSMLIFLSSLKQVPQSLYEAAEVDGANAFSKFFRITLPLLTPTIFFNLVMQMINGFLAFTQCYIITQGKPMNSTLLYTVYMYQQSFEFHNTGYGAALAWVMLAVIGMITLFLFATKRFWVYEGGL